MNQRKYTAYCGLYCKDCIPSKECLFHKVKDLQTSLEVIHFHKYAELKAKEMPLFKDYSSFYALLQEIMKLQCQKPCREGGGKTECAVRNCAQTNNLNGCWECPDQNECILLQPLTRVHPHLLEHLQLIALEGYEKWAEKRKKHYSWQ